MKRDVPQRVHDSGMLSALSTAQIVEEARRIGFDLCGVARAEDCADPQRLAEWLARGYAGEMQYLHDPRRLSVDDAMPGARSVIVCAVNYNTAWPYSTVALSEPADECDDHTSAGSPHPHGWISRYAWGGDYHDVLKVKLEQLISWMRAGIDQQFQSRAYVDTGPVLERIAAREAGLGWLAKNTCLINQKLGSWLFLGVILTDLELAPSIVDDAKPGRDLCGSCTRCIDACPTDAFVEPYVLDARRCISYLTIELRGAIPLELRPKMGSMIFGCDICQDVCPWNRKSAVSAFAEFLPRQLSAGEDALAVEGNDAGGEASFFLPELEWLVNLGEEEFRRIFRGSPVKRAKWRGMLRNVCIALGNSDLRSENPAYPRIAQRLEALASGADAMLAEHAAWALNRMRTSNQSAREVNITIHTEER